MTYAFFNFNTYLGGGETLIVRWAEYLKKEHYDFKVFYKTGSYIDNDLRQNNNSPLTTLTGHQLANKDIKFSPFNKNILCSCGFDMNINLWDVQYSIPLKTFKHHTEFVTGIDFSPFDQNILSSISFDKSLDIFNI